MTVGKARKTTPLLLGLAAATLAACANHLLRYDRGAITVWADERMWQGETLFWEVIVDSRNGRFDEAPVFRVRWPDGLEVCSDRLDVVWLERVGKPDRAFEQYGVGEGFMARLSGRFPTGTRMLCVETYGLCAALLRGNPLFLSVAVPPTVPAKRRPELGDAEGRVFHRFPLTQAQIKELLGDPDHLYWDFECRR